jgi:hypothetical protein
MVEVDICHRRSIPKENSPYRSVSCVQNTQHIANVVSRKFNTSLDFAVGTSITMQSIYKV